MLKSSRLNPVVFNGQVRPVLEYVDVIWHSSITGQQSHTIDSIQYIHFATMYNLCTEFVI